MDISRHYADRSAAFAGLAEMYADKDAGNGDLSRHIFVAAALSDIYLVRSVSGVEAEEAAFHAFAETLNFFAPDGVTREDVTVGDVSAGFRARIAEHHPYEFFYLSDTVTGAPFRFGSNQQGEQFEHLKENPAALTERWEASVYDAHEKTEQSDMWGVVSAMYNADVLAFQIWVTGYCNLISSRLRLMGLPDEISGVYYDVLWTLGLETLKGLGEIPDDDLEEALAMWRSRLLWVAGWDSSAALLEHFNGDFTATALEPVPR